MGIEGGDPKYSKSAGETADATAEEHGNAGEAPPDAPVENPGNIHRCMFCQRPINDYGIGVLHTPFGMSVMTTSCPLPDCRAILDIAVFPTAVLAQQMPRVDPRDLRGGMRGRRGD